MGIFSDSVFSDTAGVIRLFLCFRQVGRRKLTEKPMYLGQHIIYDDDHHSGVYQRVMEKLNMVKNIYQDPRRYRDTELEYPLKVAIRELALEEVRKEKYPHYPSRMGCLYVTGILRLWRS